MRVCIKIDEKGKCHLRWKGFAGETCFQRAEELYRLLREAGINVKKERIERTSEAYASERVYEYNGV
jgi:hypothetical protein